jgi:hypothetical protein
MTSRLPYIIPVRAERRKHRSFFISAKEKSRKYAAPCVPKAGLTPFSSFFQDIQDIKLPEKGRFRVLNPPAGSGLNDNGQL